VLPPALLVLCEGGGAEGSPTCLSNMPCASLHLAHGVGPWVAAPTCLLCLCWTVVLVQPRRHARRRLADVLTAPLMQHSLWDCITGCCSRIALLSQGVRVKLSQGLCHVRHCIGSRLTTPICLLCLLDCVIGAAQAAGKKAALLV
jgi:hypothetical protein